MLTGVLADWDRPVESHSGVPASGDTFSRGLFADKIFEFFFLKWCILVYSIFLSDGGPPNVAGLLVAYPRPSRRAWIGSQPSPNFLLVRNFFCGNAAFETRSPHFGGV